MKKLKTKINPKCILLLKKKKILPVLVPVYSVFPVFKMGIRAHDFKISDVCQTTFDVKNYLRFMSSTFFLRFSTKYCIPAVYTSIERTLCTQEIHMA